MKFVLPAILASVCAVILFIGAEGFPGTGMLIAYVVGVSFFAPTLVAGIFCIPKINRNIQRFSLIFSVIVAITILSNVSGLMDMNETKILKDANGTLSMEVPKAWKSEQDNHPTVLFNLKNSAGFLEIIISFESVQPSVGLKQYAEIMRENFKVSEGFISLSEPERCGKTSMECVYQTVNLDYGNRKASSFVAILKGNDNYYSYVATTTPDFYDAYTKEIIQILESMTEL